MKIIQITWNYRQVSPGVDAYSKYEYAKIGEYFTFEYVAFTQKREIVKEIIHDQEPDGKIIYTIESENYSLKIHNPCEVLYKKDAEPRENIKPCSLHH